MQFFRFLLAKLTRWDLLSMGIIALVGIVFIWHPSLLTFYFEDFNYHLMVAEQFHRAGGVAVHDFWESLPTGRPHNYPPLFHLLFSFLIYLPLSTYQLTLVVTFLSIMGALLLMWVGMRLLFGPRPAFFFAALAPVYPNFLLFLGVIIPASLVIAATPLLLYLIQKRRWFGVAALLVLIFYTHFVLPWLVLAALAGWTYFNRPYVRGLLFSAGLAILIYAPWLLHVLFNLKHIKYLSERYRVAFEPLKDWGFQIIALIFFFITASYLAVRRREELKKQLLFFLLFLLVLVPILFSTHPNRFTVSGGYFAMLVISSYALARMWEDYSSRRGRAVLCGVLLLLNLGFYSIYTDLKSHELTGGWLPALFPLAVDRARLGTNTANTIYDPAMLALVEKVRTNTREEDVINNIALQLGDTLFDRGKENMIAQFFGAMAGRPIANSRLPEYYWHTNLPLSQSAIVIADRRQTHLAAGQKTTEQKLVADFLDDQFEPLGMISNIVILKNKGSDLYQAMPRGLIVNRWLILPLVIAALIMIVRDVRKSLGGGSAGPVTTGTATAVPSRGRRLRV